MKKKKIEIKLKTLENVVENMRDMFRKQIFKLDEDLETQTAPLRQRIDALERVTPDNGTLPPIATNTQHEPAANADDQSTATAEQKAIMWKLAKLAATKMLRCVQSAPDSLVDFNMLESDWFDTMNDSIFGNCKEYISELETELPANADDAKGVEWVKVDKLEYNQIFYSDNPTACEPRFSNESVHALDGVDIIMIRESLTGLVRFRNANHPKFKPTTNAQDVAAQNAQREADEAKAFFVETFGVRLGEMVWKDWERLKGDISTGNVSDLKDRLKCHEVLMHSFDWVKSKNSKFYDWLYDGLHNRDI